MPTFDARDLNLSLDKDALKPLYKVQPLRMLFALLMEWGIIAATIILTINYLNPVTYILAVILIGSRMHALAVLMHDASHFRFFSDRKLSDLLTNLLVCWPMLVNVEGYRQNHLGHHQHLNTDEDPDWVAKLGREEFRHPQSKPEFIGRLLLYLTGIQTIKDLRWLAGRVTKNKKTPEQKRQMRIYYLILFSGLTLATLFTPYNFWLYYLAFWLVPFFTSFMMFQYIRSFAEHFGDLEYTNLLNSTRSVYPFWIEKILVAPYNIHYHLEHHLYPGVPYYNLPKLHDLLMKDENYRAQAHYSRGYFYGLLKEL